MKNVEIERKWLMDAFPDLQEESSALVEQGYLAFEPNTVRIRRICRPGQADRHILTVKGRGMLERPEVEMDLDAGRYAALAALVEGAVVRKDFKTYRLPGGEVLECSLVDAGAPTSFYYAEVEFETVEAADAFVAPGFLGEEKTNDPSFTMAAYCRRKAGAKVKNSKKTP